MSADASLARQTSYLVGGGHNLGSLEQLLKVVDGAIGNTDSADLAGFDDLLELLPSLNPVPLAKNITRPIGQCRDFGVVAVGVQRYWPVDQVQVQVVCAEVVKCFLKTFLDTVVKSFGSQYSMRKLG